MAGVVGGLADCAAAGTSASACTGAAAVVAWELTAAGVVGGLADRDDVGTGASACMGATAAVAWELATAGVVGGLADSAAADTGASSCTGAVPVVAWEPPAADDGVTGAPMADVGEGFGRNADETTVVLVPPSAFEGSIPRPAVDEADPPGSVGTIGVPAAAEAEATVVVAVAGAAAPSWPDSPVETAATAGVGSWTEPLARSTA